MLCDHLKTFPLADCFARVRIVERIELETPQIIYLLACDLCMGVHSLEFSAIDGEPDFLSGWTTRAEHIRKLNQCKASDESFDDRRERRIPCPDVQTQIADAK